MADVVSEPASIPSRWHVAQIGAREHFGIPRGFHQLRTLGGLYTDMWSYGGGGLLKRGPAMARAFAARRHPDIPSSLVHAHNIAALRRAFTSPKPRTRADEFHAFIKTGEWFSRAVAGDLGRRSLDSNRDRFFGYNTGCLELIPSLRDRGVFTVVDQIDPARTEEALVLEEMQRWPGWQSMPDTIPSVYFDRLSAEWDLADMVVVNSDWSRRALIEQGVAADKIVIVPLAVAPAAVSANAVARAKSEVVTVLWLGNVILRKGIQYLIGAAKLLQAQNIRFIVAGPVGISADAVASAPPNVEFVGRVTRDRAQDYFAAADVFVLPTISDGFALTQLEAMSHGLPVITTPNCGEVVREGIDGFIVPPRDSEQLADRILRLARDRYLRVSMGRCALERVTDFPISRPAREIEAAATRIRTQTYR
ncbi:MAG: glycosyltransferase family 4 protein [Burkholderiales bacterium]|nr:glycosyltransferase family 4 protein [Phycisphaerae bacterium]